MILLVSMAGILPFPAPSCAEPDLWFPVGEELTYRVSWGIIPVATSKATSKWIEEDGRKLLSIQFRTKSNNVIKKIYPVDDFIESVIDPETFLPVRFVKRLSEGKYRTDEVTTFDFERMKATWKSKLKNKEKEYDIEPDTRDIVTFMYYVRSEGFRPGDKKQLKVMADEKLYDLSVEAFKSKKIRVGNFGFIKTVKVVPEAAFEGIFVRKGKMILWVSEDDRRVMTRATAKTPFADVKIVLWDVKGPGDDFWIQKSNKLKKKKKKDSSNESE
jgi:hypothetical protein